jgi:hypothetical protein
MNRKAQTATEYLIILAVVIIIALIVVGVLGVIPGIGGGGKSSAKSAFWDTAKIGIASLAWAQAGNDTFTVKNNMPNTIVIQNIWIGTTPDSKTMIYKNLGNTTDVTISSGNTFAYDQDDNGTGAGKYYYADSWSGGSCTAGETVTLYFTFQYLDHDTQAVYNYSASDAAYETTCAQS